MSLTIEELELCAAAAERYPAGHGDVYLLLPGAGEIPDPLAAARLLNIDRDLAEFG